MVHELKGMLKSIQRASDMQHPKGYANVNNGKNSTAINIAEL
jgi:hypothetical protein